MDSQPDDTRQVERHYRLRALARWNAKHPAFMLGALYGLARTLLIGAPAGGLQAVLMAVYGALYGGVIFSIVPLNPRVQRIRNRCNGLLAIFVLGILLHALSCVLVDFLVTGLARIPRGAQIAMLASMPVVALAILIDEVLCMIAAYDFYRSMTGAILGAVIGMVAAIPFALFLLRGQLPPWMMIIAVPEAMFLGYALGALPGMLLGWTASVVVRSRYARNALNEAQEATDARTFRRAAPDFSRRKKLNRVLFTTFYGPRWERQWPEWFTAFVPRWVRIRLWKYHRKVSSSQPVLIKLLRRAARALSTRYHAYRAAYD